MLVMYYLNARFIGFDSWLSTESQLCPHRYSTAYQRFIGFDSWLSTERFEPGTEWDELEPVSSVSTRG